MIWVKKHRTTEHINRFFLGLSRDVLVILFMCFLFFTTEWAQETHKQLFDPHPIPGQSRQIVYGSWFPLPENYHLHGNDYK